MTQYEQGFMDKCAELGVDPAALVKQAQRVRGDRVLTRIMKLLRQPPRVIDHATPRLLSLTSPGVPMPREFTTSGLVAGLKALKARRLASIQEGRLAKMLDMYPASSDFSPAAQAARTAYLSADARHGKLLSAARKLEGHPELNFPARGLYEAEPDTRRLGWIKNLVGVE